MLKNYESTKNFHFLAGPFFYGFNEVFNKPLNKNDAQVVHVIHTDSNFFGAPSKCGHADFWPNGKCVTCKNY